MASDERISELRPEVEDKFEGIASITKALPGMLELLPLGASKGEGVQRLLNGMLPCHPMEGKNLCLCPFA